MELGLYDLIEAVKNNPILYDNTLSDFKVPEKKIFCWENIAKNLGTSEEECRKRWRTLRERYTRELKQTKFIGGTKTTSSWEFFKQLGFLEDHIKYRNRFPTKFNRFRPIDIKNREIWSKALPKLENFDRSEKLVTKSEILNRTDVEDEDLSLLDEDFDQTNDNLPVEEDEYLVETLDNGVEYEMPETPINIEPPNKMIRLDNFDKKCTVIKSESTEDDLFCSSVACTLGKFSRLHNIKAKGEIMRVLEKYVEFEEAN